MQLLVTYTTPNPAAFHAAYETAVESRSAAGLTQLQLWQDADDPTRTLALYTVNSRKKADEWLTAARAGIGLGPDGASLTAATYLAIAGV